MKSLEGEIQVADLLWAARRVAKGFKRRHGWIAPEEFDSDANLAVSVAIREHKQGRGNIRHFTAWNAKKIMLSTVRRFQRTTQNGNKAGKFDRPTLSAVSFSTELLDRLVPRMDDGPRDVEAEDFIAWAMSVVEFPRARQVFHAMYFNPACGLRNVGVADVLGLSRHAVNSAIESAYRQIRANFSGDAP